MKVGIIGAGFGGLAAGYKLAKSGIKVTILEADENPGGLAIGFTNPSWNWTMEKHYHHWFTSDWSVRNLAKEIGHTVLFVRPKTSTFIDGKIYQLDSPLSLLMFNKLSFLDRVRTGIGIARMRYTKSWEKFETVTAEDYLKKSMGENSWKVLWQPLFVKKFSHFAKNIPASWFWARIVKRSPSLGYPEGGFLPFAISLDKAIKKNKGKVYYKTKVLKITKGKEGFVVTTNRGRLLFDKVIVTSPSYIFVKIVPDLPQEYKERLLSLAGIGAINLVLSLNKQFLEDGTYWLNVNHSKFPFLAVVEHTNFMDKRNYNNEHLVYIGNYLPHEHSYYHKETVDLLREFYPFLKTINPKFTEDWVKDAHLFKAPFAQPIIPLNYSKILPQFETPIAGLYLCNIQQVYPWDRGTNYAVENGEKVADMILKNL